MNALTLTVQKSLVVKNERILVSADYFCYLPVMLFILLRPCMKWMLLTSSLMMFTVVLQAQQLTPTVLSSSGLSFGTNSFTIGEVMTQSFAESDVVLTQGFHQPEENSVAVQEYDESIAIEIYPNPVRNVLTISMPTIDQAEVKLFDATGKLVMVREVKHSDTIDMSIFSRGLYIIHLFESDGGTSHRFSIIRS